MKQIKDLVPFVLFSAYFLKLFILEPSKYDASVLAVGGISLILFEGLKIYKEKLNNKQLDNSKSAEELEAKVKKLEETCTKLQNDLSIIKVSKVLK